MADQFPGNGDRGPAERGSFALNGLFILALFYTAYFARSILLPLMMALLLAFLLRPVVRVLKKIRIPEIAGAALVLLTFLFVVGFGISYLSDPARQWIDKAPQSLHQLGQKLEEIIPFKKATKTAEELKKITGAGKEKPGVTVKPGPTLAQTVVMGMRQFIAQGAIMLILLFFILASGDLFLVKLRKMYPGTREKQQVAEIIREVEHSISRYLLTVTVINFTEGAIVGLGMYLIGMPDPVLWGVMAAFLVYVPYLGPLLGISIVTVVALLTLNDIKMALLAFAIYSSIEILQGQFLTPLILGARFEMNPVAIFIWLILWGAIWGVIGAIMAVPMLTIVKILSERIQRLKPVSEFLSS